VGEHVFLKVKAKRSSLILESCLKLAARYCGPFEILEKIRPVASYKGDKGNQMVDAAQAGELMKCILQPSTCT
jgi:hypothetical protein